METGERLAAYLAGELDAEETTALEAELARDPALRARLESIRATEAALAALPAVELPPGFSERLRAAVRSELDEELGPDGAADGRDELAARRVRRASRGTAGTRSWWPQVAVAAAVLVVAGVGLTQLTTGGSDEGAEMATVEESGAMDTAMAPPAPVAGPTVVAAGRSFDTASLRDLADDERFTEVISQQLAGGSAEAAAESFEASMRGQGDEGPATDGSGADAGEPMAAAEAEGEFGLRTMGEVSPEDLEAVQRCLPELLQAQTAVIPVYAELVSFDGQAAIVYGLVGNDPAQETHSRVELWVVGRGDCQVLHFTQVDR